MSTTPTAPASTNMASRRRSKPAQERTFHEAISGRTTIDRLSQNQQSSIRRLHRTLVKQRGTPAAGVSDRHDEAAAKIASRRRSKPAQQRTADGLRRTTIDRLSQSQQSRIRRLHQAFANSRLLKRSQWGTPTAAVPDEDEELGRWKGAMKEVRADGISSPERVEHVQWTRGRVPAATGPLLYVDVLSAMSTTIRRITLSTFLLEHSVSHFFALYDGSAISPAPFCPPLFASIDLSTKYIDYSPYIPMLRGSDIDVM